MQELIRAQIQDSIDAKRKVLDALVPQIQKAAEVMIAALKSGRKILFFGNGGSASDAQHLAAELVGRFERERRGLPGIALTTDTSILTAVANDYSYDEVFARQVEALGASGDVAVGLSTSGKSRNVNAAMEKAKHMGLRTIGFSGKKGGDLAKLSEVSIVVPSDATARIQESHIMIGHIVCDLIDRAFAS